MVLYRMVFHTASQIVYLANCLSRCKTHLSVTYIRRNIPSTNNDDCSICCNDYLSKLRIGSKIIYTLTNSLQY